MAWMLAQVHLDGQITRLWMHGTATIVGSVMAWVWREACAFNGLKPSLAVTCAFGRLNQQVPVDGTAPMLRQSRAARVLPSTVCRRPSIRCSESGCAPVG